MPTDVRSPGGWLNLLSSRVARWLVVGTLAAGGGAVAIYGDFQGAQAAHVCEALLTSATKDTVTYSCLNPLPEGQSGAILSDEDSFVFVSESASPATRLNVCTATGAAQACRPVSASTNVMSGVVLEGTNRVLSLASTGGKVTAQAPAILAPRDYTGARRYLNFTFRFGSGQTTSGDAPAFARFEITPCNLDGVGC